MEHAAQIILMGIGGIVLFVVLVGFTLWAGITMKEAARANRYSNPRRANLIEWGMALVIMVPSVSLGAAWLAFVA